MASRSATAARNRPRRPSARQRAQVRRRRALLVLFTGVGALLIALAIAPLFPHAVREITLPLRHEDIIRQQAHDKKIDPALIAGVIYAESRFRDGQTSSAGAEGLMQLTPDTAKDIARWSGGTAFTVKDL